MTLRLTCLTNDSSKNPGVTRGDDVDSYLFTPNAYNTLYFFSTTNDGEFELEISAPGYNTVVVKPYHFNKGITTRSYGLLDGVCDPLSNGKFWSNMAYGRAQSTGTPSKTERGVIFGYYDDPDCLGITQITLQDVNGNPVLNNNSNDSGVKSSNAITYPYAPAAKDASANPYYHELQLTTVGARKGQDITLVLSSPGYVTETYRYPRLEGTTRIHTGHFTASNYDTATKILKPANNSTDHCSFHLVFTPLGDAPDPVKHSSGLYLGQDEDGNVVSGSRYKLKVISGNFDDISGIEQKSMNQYFFGAFFKFVEGHQPASCEPADGCGTWFQYPGSNGWYEWLAYDDAESEYEKAKTPLGTNHSVKTMVVTVGESPILISNFTYKAFSQY